MATAFKCDRCGGFFEEIDDSVQYFVSRYDTEDVDLCNDCLKKLEKWIEGEDFEK